MREKSVDRDAAEQVAVVDHTDERRTRPYHDRRNLDQRRVRVDTHLGLLILREEIGGRPSAEPQPQLVGGLLLDDSGQSTVLLDVGGQQLAEQRRVGHDAEQLTGGAKDEDRANVNTGELL